MSWSTFAAKVFGAKPVYIYKIEKDDDVAYYTSRMADYSALPASLDIDFFAFDDYFERLDFFAVTFSKRPIAHSPIRVTQNSSKRQVTISLPRTDAFAQKFIGDLGITQTKITIWSGFEGDPDEEFQRIFIGEISLVKLTWATTSLVCEDGGLILKGKGIADVIQRPCRHALYHGLCTLSLSSWQATGSASDLTSGVVTVAEASSKADGYYAGGILEYDGVMQLITAHTGSSLSMLGGIGTLGADIVASGPQSVKIARGCNRSMTDCDSFGNSANFGGFKELTDSPFDGRSMT